MPDGNDKQNLPATAPNKAPLQSGGRISAIVPRDFEAAYRLAGIFAASGMVPKAYIQNNVANREMICVAIIHGMEVGLTPMAALQSIAVINGQPTIWGDGMIALVEASGLLEDKEERVETDDAGVPLVAICRVKRKGRAQWVEQMFTQAEAKKAGLWSKQGPWSQYPRRMMQMRARAWALRDAFPDVLRGLQSAEEARDMVDIGGGSTIPPEPTRAQFRQQSADATDVHDEGQQQTTDSTGAPAGDAPGPDASTSQPDAGPGATGADEGPAAEVWPREKVDATNRAILADIGKAKTIKAVDGIIASRGADLAAIKAADEKVYDNIFAQANGRKQWLSQQAG